MDEIKTALFGALAVIALIAIIATNTIVGVGERGVRVTLGKVSPTSLSEGIYFKVPVIQQIVKYDIKTQKSNIATTVFTKDIQQARLVYVINYNVQADGVAKLHKQVGKGYKETILTPIVEGTVKNVIGKWNASDLIANRAKATTDILAQLQQQLDDNYIAVTDFNITDIDYSDSFEKAIEGKVTAEQEALKAKNKTLKLQIKPEQFDKLMTEIKYITTCYVESINAKLLQFLNAFLPILVTESGIVIDVKLEHPWNMD